MKQQIFNRSKYNEIICNTLMEHQGRGVKKITPEIIKEIATQSNVSPSTIWIVLESRGFGGKDIDSILTSLNHKKLKSFRKPKVSLESNVQETVISEETPNPKIIHYSKHYSKKPKKPSREVLAKLYTKRGWDTVEIAERYNRERGTIYIWLRGYGIPRHVVSVKRPKSLGKPSKDELYREYIEEKKGFAEIAKIHSAGRTTIRNWLVKNEIPVRTLSEELLKNKKLPSEEELNELYIKKQISMKKIAELYKTGTRIIKRLLNNHDIPVRSYEDALSTVALKGKKMPSEEELYQLYIEEGKSLDEIAKTYGLSHPPIARLCKKYGIKIRTRRQAAFNWGRKSKQKDLEAFDNEKYKGVRGLVELFGSSADNEEVGAVIKSITSKYLYKLRNLCDTIGEENIKEELYLIAQNCKNKLEPLILHCLYKASLETGIKPHDIGDDSCGEFEALQKFFAIELRKLYVKYEIERRNNSNNNSNNKPNN